jgi:uncharacterized membrane protein required for colicin V production
MTASPLDVFGLLILAYNVLRGLTTGLIRTSVGAIAVVIASYCAWQYPALAAPLVDPWLPGSFPLAFLVRPALVWFVAFTGLNLVGIGLRWAVRITPLVIADRVGGALFGLLTGVVLLVVPMVLVANFPLLQQIPAIQQAFARSWLANLLTPLVTLLLHWAPMRLW